MSAIRFGALCLISIVASVTSAAAVANCPGTISGGYSTSDDIEVTTNTSCITVNANNLTINCNNKRVFCNNSGGCIAGVNVPNGFSSTLVKNCRFTNGTGHWTYGVLNGATSGNANTTTVQNVLTENTTISIVNPHNAKFNIFKFTTHCLVSDVPNRDGTVQQNYCNASDDGFIVKGHSTHPPTITRNYIRTPSTSLAVDVDNQPTIVDYNIFDGGSIDTQAGITYSAFNICDDLAFGLNHCAEPADNTTSSQPDFSLSLNFTP